jgi:prophage regulatory protein
MNTTRLLRRPEVERLTGLSRSCIYKRMASKEAGANSFPKPIPLGGRLVAWRSDDIEAWIQQRIEEAAHAA